MILEVFNEGLWTAHSQTGVVYELDGWIAVKELLCHSGHLDPELRCALKQGVERSNLPP